MENSLLTTNFYRIVILLSLTNCLACTTEFLNISETTSRSYIDKFESGACFTSLDRQGTRSFVRDFRHNGNVVLSGFQTTFAPGSGLIPCDRLYRDICQGVFIFNLNEISSRVSYESVESAKIVVTNYAPENGSVSVYSGSIWDHGAGGEFYSDGNLGTDVYELKRVTREWNPAIEEWAREFVYTSNLGNNDSNNRFSVPFVANAPNITSRSGGLAAEISVTRIIRDIMQNNGSFGNGVFGFAIEPVGIGLRIKRSNRSVGHFTVQLEIRYRN